MIRRDWHDDLVMLAEYAQQHSPDPSTVNAAVLYTYMGMLRQTLAVNEFPKGVRYSDDRWGRPQKYDFIAHAEEAAILKASRLGLATAGTTLVCPWAACATCARLIVQAGCSHLVTLKPQDADTHERWAESIAQAMTILDEGGVKVTFYDKPLGVQVRRNEQLITI